MVNKRLLIKNLLGHSDENSFYDRKRFIDLNTREGKAKFLKIICALANSNPYNKAFIIIGVEDESREIVGVDFFDDSRIQNLINSYLNNAPSITYENIIFPDLPNDKVVGLVTVSSSKQVCSLSKGIWKYTKDTIFKREGSNSKIQNDDFLLEDFNSEIVQQIEKISSNNIQHTLDGVINFINHRHKDLESHYLVFREQFVLCWAGKPKLVEDKKMYSRVDIELINEQVRLFFSNLDKVEICVEENTFSVTEYIYLGIENQKDYYPLELVQIHFFNNGSYKIEQKLIFSPPIYDEKKICDIWSKKRVILEKIIDNQLLTEQELRQIPTLPSICLECYLNGHLEVKELLEMLRPKLKDIDIEAYKSLKETLRILRKLKYNR
ncbi:ATP-binding protein [Capnocytophaga cynodegmi]|uniref:ATP-binding protein n=1 Tax=Capnocytophaga cynodegmi TaxID=28189 RepID=UPI001AC5E297|nr:ATP-binding protein [Capnocytophaga cynodegmi]GIM55497.1 ATPase AAA [Capnocytophaga cynodegmi]